MSDAWRSIARLGLDGKRCVDWCRSPIARLAAQYNCFLHSLFSKSFEGKHPLLQRNLLANERKAHRYYISVRSVTFCTIVSTNSPYQHITSTITPAHQHIISTPAHQHITSTSPAHHHHSLQYQMWWEGGCNTWTRIRPLTTLLLVCSRFFPMHFQKSLNVRIFWPPRTVAEGPDRP